MRHGQWCASLIENEQIKHLNTVIPIPPKKLMLLTTQTFYSKQIIIK